MAQTNRDKLVRAAVNLGLSKDAANGLVKGFERGDYLPQPKQLEFHIGCREADNEDGPTQIGFGGARGPGKSHALFAQVALDDCQRVAGLKCLYLRKIGKNAREQFEDLRRSVLRHTPHDFKSQSGSLHFPNGSRILIGHFNNESDIDNYLGLEYDLIAIEEATDRTATTKGRMLGFGPPTTGRLHAPELSLEISSPRAGGWTSYIALLPFKRHPSSMAKCSEPSPLAIPHPQLRADSPQAESPGCFCYRGIKFRCESQQSKFVIRLPYHACVQPSALLPHRQTSYRRSLSPPRGTLSARSRSR